MKYIRKRIKSNDTYVKALVEYYPHVIELSELDIDKLFVYDSKKIVDEVLTWCSNKYGKAFDPFNGSWAYSTSSHSFFFKEERQALEFKLVWAA